MPDFSVFTDPFVDYAFMRRAFAAAFALSLGGTPLGVFMMLRRMTLIGDALSHAILPGVALGVFFAGLSLWAMTLGGLAAAVLIGAAASLLVRKTSLKEDSAFTLLYLLSLAVGVTLISVKGGGTNLLHLLFGNILAVDGASLALVAGASCISLTGMAVFYRRFVIEGFDSDFLSVTGAGGSGAALFYFLLMINLVAAFQALGTLMALGLMILPALSARFWSRDLDAIMGLAMLVAVLASYVGLLLSFYARMPSGPAIVLMAGGAGMFSALFGPVGSVRAFLREGKRG